MDSAEPADLEIFTTALERNGAGINEYYPQELSNILNKVRRVLLVKANLSAMSKLNLLLAIDISRNGYKLPSPDVLKFYEESAADLN